MGALTFFAMIKKLLLIDFSAKGVASFFINRLKLKDKATLFTHLAKERQLLSYLHKLKTKDLLDLETVVNNELKNRFKKNNFDRYELLKSKLPEFKNKIDYAQKNNESFKYFIDNHPEIKKKIASTNQTGFYSNEFDNVEYCILISSWIEAGQYNYDTNILTIWIRGQQYSQPSNVKEWENMKKARGRNGSGAGTILWYSNPVWIRKLKIKK